MNETETPAGVVHHFPGASSRNPTLREFADIYMANFSGRDTTRAYSVAFRLRELGDRRILDIDADCIAEVLDRMITTPVHKYAGKDETGKPILRTHPRMERAYRDLERQANRALDLRFRRHELPPRPFVRRRSGRLKGGPTVSFEAEAVRAPDRI